MVSAYSFRQPVQPHNPGDREKEEGKAGKGRTNIPTHIKPQIPQILPQHPLCSRVYLIQRRLRVRATQAHGVPLHGKDGVVQVALCGGEDAGVGPGP